MTEIRGADPLLRRRVVWLLVVGALVGVLLILGLERYRAALREWIGSDPQNAAHRLRLALVFPAIVLCAPVIGFAAYLWAYGASVLRTGQFPPPGYRVIRDTPVVGGSAAAMRGHVLRILAACLTAACLLLWVMIWRLVRTLATGPS